ncbi:hypothetical protein Z043_125074 [Scleropages formosus]|uniref:Uncharacterized protein n=1 Tax=Scleropages formosus TaxID=113540 RepID=A0A0N8JV59_SCLFO|nr:hypothetical protein Z043_125074 [Scleropages formosus]
MSGLVVHQKWLQIQGEMYPGASRELQRLSDTRWACRYLSCHNLADGLPAVVRVLEKIAGGQTGKKSVDIPGLLLQTDLEFIEFSSCLNLAQAVELVEALICTFKNDRNEQRSQTKEETKLEATCVMSTVGSQAALNSKECFRAGIFYQVLDMMLNELSTRFSEQKL